MTSSPTPSLCWPTAGPKSHLLPINFFLRGVSNAHRVLPTVAGVDQPLAVQNDRGTELLENSILSTSQSTSVTYFMGFPQGTATAYRPSVRQGIVEDGKERYGTNRLPGNH